MARPWSVDETCLVRRWDDGLFHEAVISRLDADRDGAWVRFDDLEGMHEFFVPFVALEPAVDAPATSGSCTVEVCCSFVLVRAG